MDNKDLLGKTEMLGEGGNNFPVFSEGVKAESPDATIDEIGKLSDSARKEDEERFLSMPPVERPSQSGERDGNGGSDAEIMVQMGSDGKISGSEFNKAKTQLARMADDPAMLNDAIQGLSEKIVGGGR